MGTMSELPMRKSSRVKQLYILATEPKTPRVGLILLRHTQERVRKCRGMGQSHQSTVIFQATPLNRLHLLGTHKLAVSVPLMALFLGGIYGN